MGTANSAVKHLLPGFFRRKQEGDETTASTPLPQLAGGRKTASLASVRLQLLLAAVLLLGVLAAFCFQLMSGTITHAIENEARLVTEQVAARVSTVVDHYGASVAMLAKDPDLASLFIRGTQGALRAREESLRYVYPDAINLRLLLPGIETIDMQASPPLSYAALTQLRAAEKGKKVPPVEVHLVNSPQQHVNIVRRVMDPAGSGVVGHIMLSLSNNILQGILDNLPQLNGYIELQQSGVRGSQVMLASSGDANLRSGAAERSLKVGDSRWQVAYWPAMSSIMYLDSLSIWVLAAFLSSATAIIALIMVLFRRLNAALRLDQASMATLIKDYRDGCVRREYPVGLVEMRASIEFMTQLAGGGVVHKSGSAAPREKDAGSDKEAASQDWLAEDEPQVPDMKEGVAAKYDSAIPSDNLIVEEVPLDSKPVSVAGAGIDASIFRAYDIRGIVDRTLTVNTVKLIGSAIGSEALQRGRDTIVVGRDGRLSGPTLARALIEGITATGCNVKDIGCVPTPVLYFATHSLDTHSGVIVTGSHNPPDYNGLKIMIDGETLSGQSIQQLRERIEAKNFISGQGRVETLDIVPEYVERVCRDVTISRPLKVVVDCGNGVAGGIVPELLKKLGCTVTELFCEVDGNFPNHHPDPSRPENLQDLIKSVAANQADLGLAFDGDGDRLGVVTSGGDIVWPDRVLMLYALDILTRNPGGQIIYDVKCTRHLDKIIREHGGKPLMWKTGHSFMKAKIKETGALLAGEMSGHIFISERWFGFDDALYAGARLLEILGKDKRTSAEVFASLPDSINTPELNVQMHEGEPPVFIDKLLETAHFEDATVSTIDGLRADFEDGWGLIRASNTTPVLVLRFEADNDAALMRIMGEFRRVIQQVDAGLALPF
ncbi:MAG: phosphomannomutase/phosphoglucomutase [Gammaproteobacteria bacterium]